MIIHARPEMMLGRRELIHTHQTAQTRLSRRCLRMFAEFRRDRIIP